jgi:hypothetical protein
MGFIGYYLLGGVCGILSSNWVGFIYYKVVIVWVCISLWYLLLSARVDDVSDAVAVAVQVWVEVKWCGFNGYYSIDEVGLIGITV